MSRSDDAGAGEAGDDERDERAELAARNERLEAENRRLREENARVRQTKYRRTALGLLATGALAAAGAVAFPDSREVLLALAGTGAFAAVLVYYLVPERFLAATVVEGTYEATAETGERLVGELGLSDHRVYLPVETGSEDGHQAVRLYVPQHDDYALPEPDPETTFVVPGREASRGIAVTPTGEPLFREFRGAPGELPSDPARLADQLRDALVEQFELVDAGTTDVSEGRATLGVVGPAFGSLDRFDHPVASFFATGFAHETGVAVTLETSGGDDRFDGRITCTWTTEERA